MRVSHSSRKELLAKSYCTPDDDNKQNKMVLTDIQNAMNASKKKEKQNKKEYQKVSMRQVLVQKPNFFPIFLSTVRAEFKRNFSIEMRRRGIKQYGVNTGIFPKVSNSS